MNRSPKLRGVLAAAALAAAGSMTGCIPFFKDHGTEVNVYAARWAPDSVLVYAVHHYSWNFVDPDNSFNYKSSRLTLYIRKYKDKSSCPGKTQLYQLGAAIPCGTLGYHPQDSLLFASYVSLDPNGQGEVNCDGLPPDSVRLVAGKLSGSAFRPLTSSVDTASLLAELGQVDSSYIPIQWDQEGNGTVFVGGCWFGARFSNAGEPKD